MLRPEDIHDAQFRVRLKGYDIKQVNDFLDQIVSDYSDLYASNQKLLKSNRNLLDFKKSNQSRVGDISQALMVAQTTAKRIIDKANDKSKQSLADLHDYCKMKRTDAHKNSEAIVANAYQRASQIMLKAQYRYVYLQSQADKLNHLISSYKHSIRQSLITQLKSLSKNTVKPLTIPQPHFARRSIGKKFNTVKDFKAFKKAKQYHRQHQSIICYPDGRIKPLFKSKD